jgi:S-methylmethionine-dependent homocysteine/selenocysteine methylase
MRKILVLDGAVGTQLGNYNINLKLPIWSANANIDYPKIVTKIHEKYISAGSDVITANTFRSTPYTYRKTGLSNNEVYNRAKNSFFKAIDCAQNANSKNNVKIAGSISSLDDCYSPKKFPGFAVAEDTYGQLLDWFDEFRIDIILFKTMGNINEINIALDLSSKMRNPVWISLIMFDENTLLDGTLIENIFKIIDKYEIGLLMINCNNFDLSLKVIRNIKIIKNLDFGLYPNLGYNEFNNSL